MHFRASEILEFQFYLSSIKSQIFPEEASGEYLFQFYLSSIKSR